MKPAPLNQGPAYRVILASSLRAQWQLDDVLKREEELDFSCNFLPEKLASTVNAPGLTDDERRTLNHISSYQYIQQFEVIEEFIVPFVAKHMEAFCASDIWRDRALSNFIAEEKKHIELFKRFRHAFKRSATYECQTLDSSMVTRRILAHDPFAVCLLVLMFEWATQAHYLSSVRDDKGIEPLFKRLLQFHWIEEAQHAKLDTMIANAMARARSQDQIDGAISVWSGLIAQIDANLKLQASLNINTLERHVNRQLEHREELIRQQYLAARWMYLGCGLSHPRFAETLQAISPQAATRLARSVYRGTSGPVMA